MTYRAHIKGGVAVPDDPVTLRDGTPVLIQPIEQATSLEELLRDVAGKGKNLPSDGSIQHDHYIYGTPKR
jgi:hypothetical protein